MKAVSPALLVCLALALPASGAKITGSAPAPAKQPLTLIQQLVDQLGARNYRTRQAAHRRLALMDTDVLPVLVRAQGTRTDPEVRRRLDLIIAGLETRAMLQPKRVTLHLDKRPLPDVLAELTRQTGYTFNFDNNNNNELLTLNLNRVPFWEALDLICRKAKLTVYPYYYNNDAIRLQSYGTPPGPYVKYQQTFRLIATGFSYYRGVTLSGTPDGKAAAPQRSESLSFNLSLQTEPKLPILQVQSPIITEAYDDQNRPMTFQTGHTAYYSQGQMSPYGSGSKILSSQVSANLRRPARDSKTAKLIRGEIPVILLGQQKPEIEIDNPLAVKNRKFRGGRTEIEVEQVVPQNMAGKAYQVKLTIKEDGQFQNYDYAWQNTLQQRLELRDGNGQKYQVWTSSIYNRGGRLAQGTIIFHSNGNVVLGPPVKLVYYRWVPVRHTIKFEFKDLPLP